METLLSLYEAEGHQLNVFSFNIHCVPTLYQALNWSLGQVWANKTDVCPSGAHVLAKDMAQQAMPLTSDVHQLVT